MTARLPSSGRVVGRSVTSSTPGGAALRTTKLSRLVSTMKCRISRAPAAGETNRRRNHTHSLSIVECAAKSNGSRRLPIRISPTARRDSGRTTG